MTYQETLKLYDKVGKGITEVFKKKYPSLCYVKLLQDPPTIVKGVEFYHNLIMEVCSIRGAYDEIPDLYLIHKTISDYFGIRVDERKRKFVSKCRK